MLMTAKHLLEEVHQKYPTEKRHSFTLNDSGKLVLSIWFGNEINQQITFEADDEVKPYSQLLYELGNVLK